MGDDFAVSEQPLWWPPNRLCGHYLAPYLSGRVGGGAAMFQDEQANPLTVALGLGPTGGRRLLGELADLSPVSRPALTLHRRRETDKRSRDRPKHFADTSRVHGRESENGKCVSARAPPSGAAGKAPLIAPQKPS